ncbi:adhesion G-protein coupled receptor G5-like [Festucalex cinctus]
MKWRLLLVWLLPLLAGGDRVHRRLKGLGEIEDRVPRPRRGDVPDQHWCASTDCKHEGALNSCMVLDRKPGLADAKQCMEHISDILESGNPDTHYEAIRLMEKSLERTAVSETTSILVRRLLALVLKPKRRLAGLHISASERQANVGVTVNNSRVDVRLPGELLSGLNDTILFCMVTWPRSIWNVTSAELYHNRLLGLSVSGKNVSGLREPVNISVKALRVNESQTPRCVFLDFSTKAFNSSGCRTIWQRGQSHVTCSCDHLTYFGILMVSAQLSETDEAVLSYLSLIGCSLSLVALVITLMLFVTNRKLRGDVSMKVHANLAVALILLNVHFLSSGPAALASSERLCFYAALALHYSLLATFSWMALESFHLYLLLVRVFNIYIRRYMLKLGLLGWSFPAAIVIVTVFVKSDAYGRVALDATEPNSTQICYLADHAVKMVSTLGVFSVVFAFNLVMLVVTVHRLIGLPHRKRFGQGERGRAKQNISTLLGVSTLLGITWGLIFFSFGHLTTAGLYVFCVLNSLQGFFIFLWFVLSWRKSGPSTTSSKTPSASS